MLGVVGTDRTCRSRARAGAPVTPRVTAAVCLIAVSAAALAGCTARRPTAPPIQASTAYVAQPGPSGVTDAYLVIQNSGSPDRLISARSSAGGRVTFRGPAGQGSVLSEAVRAIGIPHDATVRFDPDGFHLLITGSGPMRAGTEITLTLVFARAGAIAVPTLVENPNTGGASYLGD
jgi:copper(I)-binding protein